jgi:hypothetical protein
LRVAVKQNALTLAHSLDLLPQRKPKMLENIPIPTRKLSNVKSVDLMQKLERSSLQRPIVQKLHRKTDSLCMRSPEASIGKPNKYCHTEIEEDVRIDRIREILNQKIDERIQVRKIREVLNEKPVNF